MHINDLEETPLQAAERAAVASPNRTDIVLELVQVGTGILVGSALLLAAVVACALLPNPKNK